MEAYTDFAYVYDTLMDNTPYEKWCEQVTAILQRHGIKEELVLDLGCGTGTLTELLAKKGYDMIGIDVSEEMLERAIEKREESGLPILYLLQDMREFELYGTVKAVVSVCDSLNYLLEDEDVIETFRLVNNYLDPEGIFIFDFNTVHKYPPHLYYYQEAREYTCFEFKKQALVSCCISSAILPYKDARRLSKSAP